jgi:type 1 glutamine amidotransferase
MLFPLLAACAGEAKLIRSYGPAEGAPQARVLMLAGPDSHGPKAHEHRAGSELLAQALHEQHPAYAIDVVYGGWPVDDALFDAVDTVVIYCDGGRHHMINDQLQRFARLLDDAVGVVTLHYAVEVPRGSESAAQMLRATGGYFETHWSVNPHWEAHFTALPEHPVTRGVAPFEMLDEWYFNMRFVPDMAGVTPILSAVPPQETMDRRNGPHSGNDAVREMVTAGQPQVVAWAYERPGGGRGFGYTGGHFHANWDDDNARQLVLNAIVWTAEGRQ